jgi:hypothetical protein
LMASGWARNQKSWYWSPEWISLTSQQRAMKQCYPNCIARLVRIKCRIGHNQSGKIQFSDFSSNHMLKEIKLAASSFPDLFQWIFSSGIWVQRLLNLVQCTMRSYQFFDRSEGSGELHPL